MADPDPAPLDEEDINPDDAHFAKAPQPPPDDDEVLHVLAHAIEVLNA